MAIIYSYPTVQPTADDLVLGTDVNQADKPTKNFTIQSIVDIVAGGAAGLGAVLKISSNAQDLTDPSNPVNQPIQNLSFINGTGSATFSSFTDGTMTISSGAGVNFVSITSVDFAGNLTGIVKTGSSIEGPVTGVTQPAGTSNTTLATTKFVMDKVDPSILTFVGTSGGNQTVNLASQTFSILGTANQIESVGTAQKITFRFPTAGVTLPNGSVATTQAITDNSTKVATTAFVHSHSAAQDLDFSGDNGGTGSVLLDSQTFAINGTANQITTTQSGQSLTIAMPTNITVSGIVNATTFAGDLLGTINTVTTGVTQSAGNNSTKIATTAYVDNAAGSKTLEYAGDATGPFSLNLTNDDLEFNGDSNITITAAAVTGNKGIVTVDLNDDVTITGTSKAGTFTTTAGTATWTTTVLAGFTSITSTSFVGALTGNASTATALATAGDISPVNDVISYPATSGTVKAQSGTGVAVEFQDGAGENNSIVYPVVGQVVSVASGTGVITAGTTVASVSGSTFTLSAATTTALGAGATLNFAASTLDIYTSGGNVRMPSFIPSTVATSKYLTNLPTPTSSTITATDTILSGMAKLQGQISATTGLAYEGTWAASTTAVANGAVSASTSLVITTADANLVKGTVVEGAGITGTVRINAITGTAVTLDTAITIADGIDLTMSPPGGIITGATAGTAASLTTASNKVNGHFYICNTIGKAEPNAAVPWSAASTPNEWAVGDWVIYVANGSTADAWQKLDMTSDITGTGAANKIAKWTGTNTLGTGLISDNATLVTIGAGGTGNFTVEGETTLGGGATNNTLVRGDLKVNKELNLVEGLGLWNSSAFDYGTTSKALFSGGGAASANTWTEVKWVVGDGTNTSDVANGATVTFAKGNGLTVGESSKTVTYEIDYLGTDNAILSATTATEPILTTDQIWFNDIATLAPATINEIKKAPISSLPFDSYDKWVLTGDTGTQDVESGNTVDIAGGTYITTAAAATDTLTITHDATTRASDTDTSSPAFGADIAVYDELTTNSTGHVTQTQLRTITLPSPVNFVGPADANTDGTAGYVPGPPKATYNGGYFLKQDATWAIPPNDQGVQTVNTTSPIEGGGSSATVTVSHKAVLTDNSGTAGTYKMADVTVDGNGHITAITDGHSGGGGGTKKGGTFTKLFTSVSGGSIAFTIDRATSGAIVFDVMLTSDTSNSCSVAKKYTVVKQFGVDPVVFKIIDTGPDGTVDFTPVFAQATTDTSIKCTITPNNLNTQKIGITIDLGFGQNDATVVMN